MDKKIRQFRFATPDDFGETQFIPGFVIDKRSNLVVDPISRADALIIYRERLIELEEIHKATTDIPEMMNWYYFSKREIETLRSRINLLQEDD